MTYLIVKKSHAQNMKNMPVYALCDIFDRIDFKKSCVYGYLRKGDIVGQMAGEASRPKESPVSGTEMSFGSNSCFYYNCGNLSRYLMVISTSTSIRIDQALYEQAKVDATIEHRSIAGQIEFWARVGRAALDNPDLPVTFVAESLASLAEPRAQATPFIPRNRQG